MLYLKVIYSETTPPDSEIGSAPSESDTDTAHERPSRPRRTQPLRIESESSEGKGESSQEPVETQAGCMGFHVERSNEMDLDEVVGNHKSMRVWEISCSPDDRC